MAHIFAGRDSNSICFLCEQRRATKTNSHFVSRSFVDPVFGKEGKEEIHAYKPGDDKIFDVYFGPSNLSNHDTEIRFSELSADFIFCPECERFFAGLESESSYTLKEKIRKENYRQNFTIESIPNSDFKLLHFPIGDQRKYRTYFISLLWRFSLLMRLKFGKEIGDVKPSETNTLRKELLNYFNIDKSDFNFASIYCITCLDDYSPTSDLLFFHPELENPYQVHLGKWYVFFEVGEKLGSWKRRFNDIEFTFPRECGSDTSQFCAAVISNTIRQHFHEENLFLSVKRYCIKLISKQSRISLSDAEYRLEQLTRKVQNETGQQYNASCREVMRRLGGSHHPRN